MTHSERLLAVFNGQRPDVIPWFADLTWWYATMEKRRLLPEEHRGDGVVRLYRELGCGSHEHVLDCPWKTEYEDVEIKREQRTEEGKLKELTEWRTPAGSIHQVKQYMPEVHTWAFLRYPVWSPRDLSVLKFIHNHQHVTSDYSRQAEQIRLWDGTGVASSIPPRSPMANLLVMWMGVSNAIYALADAPEEIEEAVEALALSDDPIYEIIQDSPAPLVYFGENITSEIVSPGIFKRFYAPYYRKRADQLHRKGKFIFVHIDGTLRGVLQLLGATGVDCAQSVTPAPVGDVEVKDLRKLAGDDIILWGGVPAALFSPAFPREQLASIVRECIRCYRDDARFMMCVCDQVPPDGEIDRVRMVSDIVEQEGRCSP